MKKLLIIILSCFAFSINTIGQSLEDYQLIAAENNPGLKAKYKEFEGALQKTAQVKSLPDPTLSFGYFISPVETRVGPQRAKLSLSQMFPWFGTLKASGEATSLYAEALFSNFEDAKNRLNYQVAAAYYPLYEQSELQQLERENIRILASYKAIATTKFENNKGTLVDVLRVDILLKESHTELEILKKQEVSYLTSFNQLLNRSGDHEVILPDTLSIEPPPFENVSDSLFLQNPLVTALEKQQKAAEAQERAAERKGFPTLGVGLDYVVVGERTDADIQDNGKDVLMPMITVGLPIFRSKYKAAQKEAQFLQERYALQKAERINVLNTEYDRSVVEINQLADRILLYQQQIEETKQVMSLLLSAYSTGGDEFEELLKEQQKILNYKRLLVKAMTRYHTAIAELDYITAKN